MIKKFNIKRKDESLTWQTICQRISQGFKLQQLEENLTPQQIVDFNDSIILDPDYQREYRASIYDESSLIESALLEIPIPPIFLASQKYKGVQVLNVVDGQHRLRAFYRYLNSEYALKGLKLLEEFNDKTINDIDIDDRVALLSRGITSITFRDFPGKDFELEIFNRYNKGTKPLTPQEIRHAVFDSRVNDMVNSFCTKLMNEPKSTLAKAYAISKDRFQKKTFQENIFVMLSIVEYGIDQKFKNDRGIFQKVMKSPQFADSYMKIKSENDSDESFLIAESLFRRFNSFVIALTELTEYPFSREIYGVSQRGNKFQVSISMILSAIFRKMVNSEFDFSLLESQEYLKVFQEGLSKLLSESYLEDPDYNASTTNPIEIERLVGEFSIPSM